MPRTIAHNVDKRSLKKKRLDFLRAMEETASVRRACVKCKVPRRTIYDWREKDEEFEKEFQKSRLIAADNIEDEAVRRGYEGYLKPVYQNGKKVGTIREYSDTLLVLLLKGNLPDRYKDRFAGELSGQGGGPIKHQHKNDDIDYDSLPTEVLDAILNARKTPNE